MEKWRLHCKCSHYFQYFCHLWNNDFFNPHKDLLIQLKVNQFKYEIQVFKFSLINTTEKIENICSEYFLWCGTTALPSAVIESNHSVEAVAKKNTIITSKEAESKQIKAFFFLPLFREILNLFFCRFEDAKRTFQI